MASSSSTLYVTFVDVDRNLLKVWGQRNRISATYIERQIQQLVSEFNKTDGPNPSQVYKGIFCYAKCMEGNYFRARVISNVQADSVVVIFIDYGNKDLIHISNIRLQEGNEDVLAKMVDQAEEFYLAKVVAPAGGWTKEIISEIQSHICYEELVCQAIDDVGDQKILEIQFHKSDFSSYLIEKNLAQYIPLNLQSQMILSYCSLVTNNENQSSPPPEITKYNFSTPLLLSHQSKKEFFLKATPHLNLNKQCQQQGFKFGKPNNFLSNFSQLPSAQYHNVGPPKITVPKINKTSPLSYTHAVYKSPVSEVQMQPVNHMLDPLVAKQYNSVHSVKEQPGQLLNSFNNVVIEALAQQIKQFIAEGNAKSAAKEEEIPYNYVNSVLKVGSTHNVFIPCIDDGPWSFSIQLVSCQDELSKLMEEMISTELVPLKLPIVLGHPCICASIVHRNLCRGVVVSVSHSAVKVYFVDFGNTEDLPLSSIYELPHKFFKTRVLSQKFCLSGLQKVTYSEEIKVYFRQVVEGQNLMLRVCSLEGDNLPSCELYLKDINIKRILNEKIQNANTQISQSEQNSHIADTENVVVTWVESLQRFYVQLCKRDIELNALKNELSQVDLNGQKLVPQDLRVGLRCVCKYNADGQWYRAEVTSVISENNIQVFYIDYGNTETVNISLLRKVSQPGLINTMSKQAIHCCLQGFECRPYEQGLSNELEYLTLEKNLKMTVVSSDKERLYVRLFNAEEDIVPTLLKSYQKKSEQYNNNFKISNDDSYKDETSFFEKKSVTPYKKFEKQKSFGRVDSIDKKNDHENSSYKEEENWRVRKQTEKTSYDHHETKQFIRGFKQQEKENIWNEEMKSEKFAVNQGWNDRKLKFDQDKYTEKRSLKADIDNRNIKHGKDFDPVKKKFDALRDSKWKCTVSTSEPYRGKKFERKNRYGFVNNNLDGGRKCTDHRKNEFDKKNTSIHGGKSNELKKYRSFIKKDEIAPEGSKFQERIINVGDCERAIVTYYVNPHEFYIQLLSDEEKFKKMMHDIQIFYSDKYSMRDNAIAVGDIVIAQFSFDDVLYRGEILKTAPLTVLYVDYGNHEEIGPKRLWPVTKQFLELPMQVVRCRLAHTEPVGSEWPALGSELDKFFESEEYTCTFINIENGICEVKMEFIDSGKDVSHEIIAAELGVPETSKMKTDWSLLPKQILRLFISHVESFSKFFVILNPDAVASIKEEICRFTEKKENLQPLEESLLHPGAICLTTGDDLSWLRGTIISNTEGMVSIHLIDRGDVINVSPNKVVSLPKHLKFLEPQAVECRLNNKLDSISLENFKAAIENQHLLVSVISETDNRLSVVLYDQNGNILDFQSSTDVSETVEPVGQLSVTAQKIPIVISHCERPQEIYIQRACDMSHIENLSCQLADFYDDMSESLGYRGEEGTLVAAKSVAFGRWYRGRTIGSSGDSLKIFYFDLGKTENLPVENVKNLDSSFFLLSSFARKVSLDLDYEPDAVDEVNSKLDWLTGVSGLLGYFVNVDGTFFAEFTLKGSRITPTLLNSDSSKNDKFKNIIPMLEIEKVETGEDESLKVFVVHIDSPKKFWIHKESSVNDLQQFQDELQKVCESLPDQHDLKAHDIVAARFADLWYRAEVLTVDGDTLTVQFTDYGNVLNIDLRCEKVKKLAEEFLKVPTFAVQCALKGNWEESATAKFEEIILEYEDPVNVVILEEGNPVIVDLLKDGQSIIETLVRSGTGRAEEPEKTDLCSVYMTHCNSPDDFYLQRECSTRALANISEGLYKVDTTNDIHSPREGEIYAAKFLEDGAWYRAKLLKRDEEFFQVIFVDYGNVSNVTELKVLPPELVGIPAVAENYSLIYGNKCDSWSKEACLKFIEYADGRELKMKIVVNRAKRPIVNLFDGETNICDELEGFCKDDERNEVYVCHVNSPEHFYIRHVHDDKFNDILCALENGDTSTPLQDKSPGTHCLVDSDGNGSWCRGIIIQNKSEGCEVFLIDYGKTLISFDLREPLPDIVDIPPRAIKCGLNLLGKNIPESVKEEFIRLTSNGGAIFRARIIVPGDVNIVSLKLKGRIIEHTLSLETTADEITYDLNPGGHPRFSGSVDDETDDDKSSKKTAATENHLTENSEYDARVCNVLQNETDEEKRIKKAISASDIGTEAFTDDEKGSSEAFCRILNATDSDLIEGFQESDEEVSEKNDFFGSAIHITVDEESSSNLENQNFALQSNESGQSVRERKSDETMEKPIAHIESKDEIIIHEQSTSSDESTLQCGESLDYGKILPENSSLKLPLTQKPVESVCDINASNRMEQYREKAEDLRETLNLQNYPLNEKLPGSVNGSAADN